MARVFSPAGIVFKGSGFYLTDSRKAAEASAAAKTTPSSSDAPASTPATPAAATPAPAAPAAAPSTSKSESAA